VLMTDTKCAEYAHLEALVDGHLRKLRELTNLQLEVFRSKNYESFTRMDRQLEMGVGEKERAIGALKQHAKEHKCQPAMIKVLVNDPD